MLNDSLDLQPTTVIRPTFTAALSRVCLTLGLGHFICVPILYYAAGYDAVDMGFRHYSSVVTLTGGLLLVISFLFRYERFRPALPYLCFGVLFLQAALFVFEARNLFHPIAMAFPLLASLATPILGRRRSYAIAALSAILLLSYALMFTAALNVPLGVMAPPLMFLNLVLLLSAYLSETLWEELRSKEQRLRIALADAQRKAEEMERWIHQLGEASSLISAGDYTAPLPKPLPNQVFHELTHNLGQMQERLQQYFSEVLLKDRLSSVGVLAAGVAHEINTPLTTIQFLLDAAGDSVPRETRERIEKQVQHLSSIAKGLLTFSWQKAEGMFDLNEVVRAAEPLMGYMRRESLHVHFQFADGDLPVHGMANQIQQVLVNLFTNAADALEGRAQQDIWITTGRESGNLALLEFRDNGCGMSKETLGRVLDPFFTTKLGKGTGLGLFVVHQIVKAHGAALEIESEVDRGTTIRIYLPTQEAARKAA